MIKLKTKKTNNTESFHYSHIHLKRPTGMTLQEITHRLILMKFNTLRTRRILTTDYIGETSVDFHADLIFLLVLK